MPIEAPKLAVGFIVATRDGLSTDQALPLAITASLIPGPLVMSWLVTDQLAKRQAASIAADTAPVAPPPPRAPTDRQTTKALADDQASAKVNAAASRSRT